jgi:hypothetical protein
MALNPFFLHGTKTEQGLVQDLINEQIRMYGLEVTYIPRRYIRTDNIIKEVQSSTFKESFPIEAYMNNYEGYGSGMDIMTKFGIQLKNEVSLVISRERFENYIQPLLQGLVDFESDPNEGDLLFATRPKEGDLIYFPLGDRLFEIKHVEFENPFYQLGKNYVYELKCELFEYEDEKIDINVPELEVLNEKLAEKGYITTLTLVSLGITATAEAFISDKNSVTQIYLNDDGFGYTTNPNIVIEQPPAPLPYMSEPASAFAFMESTTGSFKAIKSIALSNAGFGYTTIPKISIVGGGGAGAAATCSIGTNSVYKIDINNPGEFYFKTPTVSIEPPVGGGVTATAVARLGQNGTISNIYITNAGSGYTSVPVVTISDPSLVGFGTYQIGETVIGQQSGAKGTVKKWSNPFSYSEKTLEINLTTGEFLPGEIVVGSSSSAYYSVKMYDSYNNIDKYNQNKDFQIEAQQILDTTEGNPFGFY